MLKTVLIGKKINGVTQLTKIVAMSGDRIVLVDAATNQSPKHVTTKLINNDLYIFEDNATDPSVILKDYTMFQNSVQVSGIGEGGSYINYVPVASGGMELGATSAATSAATSESGMSTMAIAGLGALVVGGIAVAAGGGGGGGSSSSSDTTAPTATITLSDTNLKAGETATVTIVFSEVVKNFSNADVTVENGFLSTFATVDNITWTAILTPTADLTDTTNVVSLSNTYNDIAGNTGTAAVSANYAVNTYVDSIPPTATVSLSKTELAIGESAIVTIVFSEEITAFTLDDLTAQNGTLSDLATTDNITWTATFTPSVDLESTTNVITLASTYTDTYGNTGTSATSDTYLIDTKAPVITITDDENAIGNIAGGTITYTFTFSEAVTGFTADDITVNGGSKGTFSGSGSVYTLVVTPTSGFEGDMTVSIADGSAYDTIGNTNIETQSVQAVDMAAPTIPSMNLTNDSGTANDGITNINGITVTLAADMEYWQYSLDSGATWTLGNGTSFDISTDTIYSIGSIQVRQYDSAGNVSPIAKNTKAILVDATDPILTITDDEPMVTANMDGSNTDGTVDSNGADILYTFTFNEAVKDFTVDDIVVTMQQTDGLVDSTYTAATDPSGQIFKTFTKISDTVYTLGIRPETGYEGVMKVSVAPTAAIDVAGNTIDNANPSTLSSLQVVDMLAPIPNDTAFDGVNDWQYDYTNKSITFTLNSTLEAVNMTNPDNFVVEVNTKPAEVLAVAMLDNKVTLIMAESFTSTESVRVTYKDASSDMSAAIQDLSGNDATSFTYLKPDVTPPALLDILFENSTLSIGQSTGVTLKFSEELTDLTVSFQNGTLTDLTPDAQDASIWTATFTPSANLEDGNNAITAVSFHDLNLIANATTGSGIYFIDTLAPNVMITNDQTGIANIAGGSILYTFTFNEAVTGFTGADITVKNGSKGTFTALSSSVYTLEVTPTAGFEGELTVDVAADKAFDLLLNPNTAAEQSIQIVDMKGLAKPSFVLKTDSGIDANDGITNINGINVTVDSTAASWEYSLNGGVAWSEGNGTSFNLLPDTLYAAGSIQVRQTDIAGNVSPIASNTSEIIIDKSSPVFTSMSANASAGTITITMDSILDPNAIASKNFTVYVNGIAATVTGASVSGSDIILSTGSSFASNAAIKVTYADIIGDENAPALADLAGNSAFGFTQVVYDSNTPTATISLSSTTMKAGDTATVTITFSEAVQGFSNADVTAANGTLSTFTTTDNIIWTSTFTPTANIEDTTNVISLANTYTDLSATAGTSATSSNYTVDTLAPTVTITDDESGTGNIAGGNITYTFTFSEAVSGFTASDIIVMGGAKGTFSGSGSVYTLVVTPTAGYEGDITVDVAGSSAVDAALNPNAEATQSVQAVDMKAPTLQITDDQSGTGNITGGNITYTFTFSETMVGFTADDITVTNGIKGAFSGSGSVYTLVVTPVTGLEGDITVSVAAANQVDQGGNTGTLVSVTQTVDMLAPAAPTFALATDSGISATDNITNNPTINVSGIAVGATWEYSLNSGTTWIAGSGTSFTLANNTDYAIGTIQVRQTDAGGNVSPVAQNSGAISIDTQAPHLTITDDEPMVTANMDGSNTDGSVDANGADILYTFTFSEAVKDFTVADIAITNGAAKTFTKVSDTVYTLGVTPTSGVEGDMTVSVDPTLVHDIAGNAGELFVPSTQAIDMLAPTFVSATTDSATDSITLTYSEVLDAVNMSNVANFSIEVNGVQFLDGSAILSVGMAADGQHITLALKGLDILGGDTVRLAYSDATGDLTPAIQDLAGNDATSFGWYTTAVI